MNLSSSAISLFKDCPKCFYLDKNLNIKRPKGIFPSLPGGMDRKIKTYFDDFRLAGIRPPELNHAQLESFDLFFDWEKLKAWRQWNARAALKVVTPRYTLIGGFDDVLFDRKSGLYASLDYKTTGAAAGRSEEDAIKYYQTQMDLQALLLEENKYPTAGFSALLTFSPLEFVKDEVGGLFRFQSDIQIIETDIYRAKGLLDLAVVCLAAKEIPPASESCEYCEAFQARNNEEEASAAA